jgi:hypothetical protein
VPAAPLRSNNIGRPEAFQPSQHFAGYRMVTAPVRRSYTPPTIFNRPSLTRGARIGCSSLRRSTPICTFFRIAFSSASPAPPLLCATAGLISSTRPSIAPDAAAPWNLKLSLISHRKGKPAANPWHQCAS